MKKKIFYVVVLILCFNFTFGQNGVGNDFLFQETNGGLKVPNLPVKKGVTQGSYYLVDEWRNGNITLTTDQIIENYPIKVNIKDKNIEIKTDDDIKLLELSSVSSVEWSNNGNTETFINAATSLNNTDLGFAQIFYDGNVKLFSKPTLVLLPANYNAALASGTNNDKYTIEQKLFIFKNENLISVRNSKSSIIKALSDKETEIKSYIKENNINCKETVDLVKVIKYYNELI